jgi:hypothetical protein
MKRNTIGRRGSAIVALLAVLAVLAASAPASAATASPGGGFGVYASWGDAE